MRISQLSVARRMAIYMRIRNICAESPGAAHVCVYLRVFGSRLGIGDDQELSEFFPEFYLFKPENCKEASWFRNTYKGKRLVSYGNEDRVFALQMCIEMIDKTK